MSDLSDSLAEMDRLIHEPARLALLTTLSAVASADFLFLQRLTGLTAGNLSTHLARLEEAGLVRVEKTIRGKRPHTEISLTPSGREATERHWNQLDALRRQARGASFGK